MLNNLPKIPEFSYLNHLSAIKIIRETSREYHCLCPSCGDGGFKVNRQTGAAKAFKCGCSPEAIREAISPIKEALAQHQKPIKPKQKREYIYSDRQNNPLIKVVRIDDGNGRKRIFQEHWNGKQWVKGYGNIKRENVAVYRYKEIREAIARGETIFIVEGESCAESLWQIGLPATTNIGGAGKWLESHTEDVKGAVVVLCPDRDIPGVRHCEAIAEQLHNCSWLYSFPDSELWKINLPPNQGLDVADWIESGATEAQLIKAIEPELRKLKTSTSNPEKNKVIDFPATKPKGENLLELIDLLIQLELSESELKAEILTIASDFGKSAKDIWSLYFSRSKEQEESEQIEETKTEVDKLLKIQDYQLRLNSYLPSNLAVPLEKLAIYMGVNNATILTTLLTASASLLPLSTELELIKSTNFYAKPILYSGICAPSGSGKSPALKAILQPLFNLQAEEDHRYNLAIADYEEELRLWKGNKKDSDEPTPPPPPREYFVTDATAEAIANIQNNQPNNGFLGYFDELKQLLGQSNSYRSGKGADIEKLLSGRDGSGFKVNRASGKRISCHQSGYSILGGIQPEVLRKQMGDFGDGNGFWARFIWVNQPMQKKPFPDDEVSIDINPLLRSLYEFLGKIDRTFILDKEAKAEYRSWFNFVEEQKLAESKSALQAVWSKSQRLAGELALLLHCLRYAADQSSPPERISAEIMSAAIKLTKFYIGQIKLIHSQGNPDNPDSSLYSKIIEVSKQKGWLTARTLKQSIWQLKDKTANQVRSLFKKLVDLGYGEIAGAGSKIKWIFKNVEERRGNVDDSSTLLKDTQNIENTLFEKKSVDECRGNVDEKKSSQSYASHTIERKSVEDVDEKILAEKQNTISSFAKENVDDNLNSSEKSSTLLSQNLNTASSRGDKKSSTLPLQFEFNESQNVDLARKNKSVEENVDESSTASTFSTISKFKIGDRVKIIGSKVTGILTEFFACTKTWTIKTDPGFSVPFESKVESMIELIGG